MGKLKNLIILRSFGRYWWRLNKEQRKSIADLAHKLALASLIPVFVTPFINEKPDSVSGLFFMLIYAIIFEILAVLALIEKE